LSQASGRAPAVVPYPARDSAAATRHHPAIVEFIGQTARLPAVPSLLAVAVAVWAWQVVAERGLAPPYILPLPAKVLAAWEQLLSNGALWRHVSATLSEALLGFVIACCAGAALGYPLARSETLNRLASPFIATTQAMPMIALAPLLVMWFGLGLTSKMVICGLVVFFPILVNTIVGLRSIDREMTDAARTLGAGAFQIVWFVEVPLALRPLLGGVRIGLTLAMTGAIVGEFVASDAGLGFLMVLSRTNFDPAMVFAASLTMAAISTVLYKSVAWLEQTLIDW
jgi:NitT/TauT family transport system permease protein